MQTNTPEPNMSHLKMAPSEPRHVADHAAQLGRSFGRYSRSQSLQASKYAPTPTGAAAAV